MLGSAYHSVGDEQASRKNFARAFELKDSRLTQEENFQTTATYHWNITGNLEKENAVLVLYQQAYPRSVFAANLLGIDYSQLGRTEEALQEFNWAIDHSPVPSAQYYSNASQALMNLGRLDEAKRTDRPMAAERLAELLSRRYALPHRLLRERYRNDGTACPRNSSRMISAWLQLQMQFAFLRGDIGKFRSLSETAGEPADPRQARRKTPPTSLLRMPSSNPFSETMPWRAASASHAGEGGSRQRDRALALCRGIRVCRRTGPGGSVGGETGSDAPRGYDSTESDLPLIHSIIERAARKRGQGRGFARPGRALQSHAGRPLPTCASLPGCRRAR